MICLLRISGSRAYHVSSRSVHTARPFIPSILTCRFATMAAQANPSAAAGAYTHLFVESSQTDNYKTFRPSYNRHCPQMYDAILEFAGLAQRNLAVDVATGSGQAIAPLAKLFKKVIGQDASSKQLQHAPPFPNVEYQEADAHSMGLPDGCADLITVAQAAHWFDRPRFYGEAARVLQPHGTLALITYDFGELQPAAGPLTPRLQELYYGVYDGVLGPFWEAPRDIVNARYRDIEPLDTHFKVVTRQHLDMVVPTSVEALLGYVGSWSAFAAFRKEKPEEAQQLLSQFRSDLLAALNTSDASTPLKLTQTLTLVMGKHPKKG